MKINEILTPDELALVTRRSDARGAWMVFCQWAIVIGIFVVAATWTNPLTLIVGTILLGGRHLGFGVLGHECGHRTLFRSKWLNDFVGDWIVTPPRFGNNRAYMRGHLKHHRLAGTRDDPDLGNYRDYPITTERLKRKLTRDFTGQTGWREVKRIGLALANLHKLPGESRNALLKGVAMNLAGLLLLTAFGEGWLYLMWVAAFVFVQPAISRIRQVAEHAAVPDLYDLDPRKNTRTIYARWPERLVFAPHRVNYHLEHHMLASVPAYRLKTLHEILAKKGYYDDVDFPVGYLDLLGRVTAPVETVPA
ncbi:MAG: fatty acid desaturase family protein [Pseudomonadales bacterium]|nr:fatty acid desaturase family protein [Pseudomonadales bacterium]